MCLEGQYDYLEYYNFLKFNTNVLDQMMVNTQTSAFWWKSAPWASGPSIYCFLSQYFNSLHLHLFLSKNLLNCHDLFAVLLITQGPSFSFLSLPPSLSDHIYSSPLPRLDKSQQTQLHPCKQPVAVTVSAYISHLPFRASRAYQRFQTSTLA